MTNPILGNTSEGARETIENLARERIWAERCFSRNVPEPAAGNWPSLPGINSFLEDRRMRHDYQMWLDYCHARSGSFSQPTSEGPSVLAIHELKHALSAYADAYSKIVGALVDEFLRANFEHDDSRVAGEPAGDLLEEFEESQISKELCSELEYDDECLPLVELKIREIMRSKGINQTQLAEMIGISSASISKVLKSPEKSKIVTLAKIAKALNVSLGMFFRESPNSTLDA